MTGSRPAAAGDSPAQQQNFWAGPALIRDGEHPDGPPMAILVLWEQPPADPRSSEPEPPERADGSDQRSTLLDRGFVRLRYPTFALLEGLPALADARVRLSGDGHDLRIDDRGDTLFEGDLAPAPDDWWTTAQQGRFALLVDTAPVPDQATPDLDHTEFHDLSAWATQRMIDACRAEAMVGARIEVVTD